MAFRNVFRIEGIVMDRKAKDGKDKAGNPAVGGYFSVAAEMGRKAVPFYVPDPEIWACVPENGAEVSVEGRIAVRGVVKAGKTGAYAGDQAEVQIVKVGPPAPAEAGGRRAAA